eukprot:tig00000880_g5190.t1
MKAGFLSGRAASKKGVFDEVLPSGCVFRVPDAPTSSLLAALVPEKHRFVTPELRKRLDPVPVFAIAIGDEPLVISYRSPKAPASAPAASFAFLFLLPKDVEEVFKRVKQKSPELFKHCTIVALHLDEALELESWSREHEATWGFRYRFFSNAQHNEEAAVLHTAKGLAEEAAVFRRAAGENNFAPENAGLVPMFVSQMIRMAAAEGSTEQQTPLFFTLADVDYAVAQLKAAGGPSEFAEQERPKWVDPGSLQRVVASMIEAGRLLDIDEEWAQVCFFPNTEATEYVQRMDAEVNEAPPESMYARRGAVAYDDDTIAVCNKVDAVRDRIARLGELGEFAPPGDLLRMLVVDEARLRGDLERYRGELARMTRDAAPRAARALAALAAGPADHDLPAHREVDLRLGSARRELDGARLALVRRLAKPPPRPDATEPPPPEEVMSPISRSEQLAALRHIAELAAKGVATLEMHLEGCVPLVLTLLEAPDTAPELRAAAAAAALRFCEADQSAKRRILEENGAGPLLAAAKDAGADALARVAATPGFFNALVELLRSGPPAALEEDLEEAAAGAEEKEAGAPPAGALVAGALAPVLRALRSPESVANAGLVLRLAAAQPGQAALFGRPAVAALVAGLGWGRSHPAARETLAQCLLAVTDAKTEAVEWFGEEGAPPPPSPSFAPPPPAASPPGPPPRRRAAPAGALPAAVECARRFGAAGEAPAARAALRLLLVGAQHREQRAGLLKAGAFEAALALLAGPTRAAEAPVRLAAALLVSLLALRDRLRLDAAAADAVGRVADSMDVTAAKELPWASYGPLGELLACGVPSLQLLAAALLADLSCARAAADRERGALPRAVRLRGGGAAAAAAAGAGEEPLVADMFLAPSEPIEVARERQRAWERRRAGPQAFHAGDPRAAWIQVYARTTLARLCAGAGGVRAIEEEVQAKCAEAWELRHGERAALEARVTELHAAAEAAAAEGGPLRERAAALEKANAAATAEAGRARAAAAEAQAALRRLEAEAAQLRAQLLARPPAEDAGAPAPARPRPGPAPAPAPAASPAPREEVLVEDAPDDDELD